MTNSRRAWCRVHPLKNGRYLFEWSHVKSQFLLQPDALDTMESLKNNQYVLDEASTVELTLNKYDEIQKH